DNRRNVWYVAMLSMGEGWHNNNHAFHQSARHGLTPKEVDPTWIIICLLKMLGLAKQIRLPKSQRNHTAATEYGAEEKECELAK
ncbi:MAG: acyl-CoA desaturase, partial [Cyanobacteria bacterium SZAS LIN-5]|nr:acyl-CoA desaturase [Cyanobacteria bacterium SZAS LIN-5]